jgi:hypothetical protein
VTSPQPCCQRFRRKNRFGPCPTAENVPSKRVRAVGGGPAGALCVNDMAERGFAVTLFEAYPHHSKTLCGKKAFCIVVSPRGARIVSSRNFQHSWSCHLLHSGKTHSKRNHSEEASISSFVGCEPQELGRILVGLLDEASKAGVQVTLWCCLGCG